MWDKVLDGGKQLFSLAQKVQKHNDEIKEMKQDIKDLRSDLGVLRQDVNDLARVVERLAFEMQKDREVAQRDHENLVLRLENALLRSGRTLPPGNNSDNEVRPLLQVNSKCAAVSQKKRRTLVSSPQVAVEVSLSATGVSSTRKYDTG